MRSVHFGTFDAERWWRPPGLAELPAVRTGGQSVVETMDEVLLAGCAPGDLLVTRRRLSPAVLESFAEAGVDVDHRWAEDGTSSASQSSVEGLLLGDRTLAARAARYD